MGISLNPANSFTIECPKCGTLNNASNFILAKKVIKCGTCNHEINVKESSLVSKQCHNCGKIFMQNQAKKNEKCPHCGTPELEKDSQGNVIYDKGNSTVKYKVVTVHCPQCGCGIEANSDNIDFECPLCGNHVNVATTYAKQHLAEKSLISLIKYEGDNDTLVWKHPIEDFNLGSRLIVHASQEAILFINGQALGPYPEGDYTLTTENIPMLRNICEIPTDGVSPFHCEVYFVNKTVHLGLKWGTPDKIRFLEPQTGIPLEIGASGELNLTVSHPMKLVVKLVGTTNGLSNKQVLSSTGEGEKVQKTLQSFFRAPVVMGVKSHLSQAIRDQKINILEIDSHLDSLSLALRDKLSVSFEEYGLTIPEFYITNIILPEEDKNFQDMRTLISATWIKVREAEVAATVTAAQRQVALEQEKTELERLKIDAERTRIRAQAEADAELAKGITEAKIMAAKGYTQKDVLSAEVQKAYAEGMGNMGSNGGQGGGIASDIIGVIAGFKAAGAMGEQFNNIIPGMNTTPEVKENTWKCICGHDGNRGKFCEVCGKEQLIPWTCECGHTGNLYKFCGGCGKPKTEAWDCSCGHKGNKGKFCEACGKSKDAKPENTGWNCSCGHSGNTGAFCGGCGSPKPQE